MTNRLTCLKAFSHLKFLRFISLWITIPHWNYPCKDIHRHIILFGHTYTAFCVGKICKTAKEQKHWLVCCGGWMHWLPMERNLAEASSNIWCLWHDQEFGNRHDGRNCEMDVKCINCKEQSNKAKWTPISSRAKPLHSEHKHRSVAQC